MSFLSRLVSRRSRVVPGGTPSAPTRELETFFGSAPTGSGVTVTPDTALAASAVLACVRVLSESVASLPCHLYRRLEKGKERATEHALYSVMHSLANPEMTAFDFFEMQMAHILLRGNAYAYIERDRGARVLGLWPLRPDQVRVERRSDGELWYVWTPDRVRAMEFQRNEILHVHGLSRDGLIGLSPVALAAETFGLSIAQTGFASSFFGNGTVLGGTLEHPSTLSTEAAKRLAESVRAAHEGFSRAHKLMVLEEGMKYAAIGVEPEAAQFLESRRFQVEEIARIYRVPLHLIQSLERATFSNIEHQGLDFVVHSLRPWLVRMEQSIARDVLLPRERESLFVEFLVDGLLRGDLDSRYKAYATGRQWGWLSADDVREKENMNPLPDGKGGEYLSPLNMIPAGTTPDPSRPTPSAFSRGSRSVAVQCEPLRGVVEDALARVLRREIADVERAVERLEASRNAEAFGEWREKFAADHGEFVERALAPALSALAQITGAEDVSVAKWCDQWRAQTLEDLGAVQTSDAPRERWQSLSDQWRAQRVEQCTRRLFEEVSR